MFNSIRGLFDRFAGRKQTNEEIEDEQGGPYHVGPNALTMEEARVQALKELEEGDTLNLTPNTAPEIEQPEFPN